MLGLAQEAWGWSRSGGPQATHRGVVGAVRRRSEVGLEAALPRSGLGGGGVTRHRRRPAALPK